VQFGVGFAVVDDDFGFEFGGGGVAEPGGAGADFEAGVGAVEGFALLAGEQLGEFLGGAFDGVGGLEQRGGPGVVAQGSPRGLGGLGGGYRALEVFNGVDRRLADDAAGGRIENGPAVLAGRGGNGREEGIVGFQEVLHFE
jgi:hypothetical protein